MELNRFYNHAVYVIRPQNTESGELELKNVGEKYQHKNDIIIHNTIINERRNQITDTIQIPPPLPG